MALLEVEVEEGKLRGTFAGNQRVAVYKGVPYAAPPVGSLRFRPPVPMKPWDGVREAYLFGDACHQKRVLGGGDFYQKEFYAERRYSEDVLTANIWTPAKTPEDRLPVAFWIHGGGMQHGDCINMAYDGEAFAKRGVIFVTIGYRLNVFGFLAHRELTEESRKERGVAASGNYAYRDILAALQWVKRNIAAFGGDPDRVTILGQSGGAGAVMDLAAMPKAQGLFQRCVMQSGGGMGGIVQDKDVTLADAEQIGEEFFRYIGVRTVEEARQIPGGRLVEYYYDFCRERPKKEGDSYSPFGRCQDNDLFFESTMNAVRAGRYADVDYLTGTMADEFTYIMGGRDIDLEKYRREIGEKYGVFAEQYLKAARADTKAGAEETERRSSADHMWASAQAFSEKQLGLGRRPVFQYFFSHPVPGDDHKGAFHSGEHAYVFQTFLRIDRPYTGRDLDLSNCMCDSWCNFIKTGMPNDGAHPFWIPYTKQCPLVREFGGGNGMIPMPETPMSAFLRDYALERLRGKAGL